MGFTTQEAKGLARYIVDEDIPPQALRMHISEIPPGARGHAPHTHAGIEAFYVLEGRGTVEVAGESHSLGPGEAILVDTSKPHGLANAGAVVLRYLVIIAGH